MLRPTRLRPSVISEDYKVAIDIPALDWNSFIGRDQGELKEELESLNCANVVYARKHGQNIWFTLATVDKKGLKDIAQAIRRHTHKPEQPQ